MKVFVVMPFAPEYRDTYELGVKAACKKCGVECERVDEQIFGETILERIYTQIAGADLILAVMTGKNPNVFYEVGYAHGLKKRVVPLIHEAREIPFDLRAYPHIVYGGSIADLKRQLEKIIKHYITHKNELGASGASNVSVHPCSGEWAVTTELSRWRRISLKKNDQVIFQGSMLLFMPTVGRGGRGCVTGHLDVRVGECKARFSIIDEMRDALIDTSGSLRYVTKMTCRHRLEISGTPPQEDGFEPELRGIIEGEGDLRGQQDGTMKGDARYKSFGKKYTAAVTTIRRVTS